MSVCSDYLRVVHEHEHLLLLSNAELYQLLVISSA